MEFEIFVTPGLGDNSYLVWSGEQAILVDPQRDVWRFQEAASKRGLSIRYVVETHVHNDYLSGARAVEAATGATIAGPARGGYTFGHRGLREGDEIRIGDLTVVALETPGHTPEHLSYLVLQILVWPFPLSGRTGSDPCSAVQWRQPDRGKRGQD